jgi:hypothetical protein
MRFTRDSILHELGHCFTAAHFGCEHMDLEIHTTLADGRFVLPEGRRSETHLPLIHDEGTGDALRGWERASFAIALGGEIVERMVAGATLEDIMRDGSVSIDGFFSESIHDGDRISAVRKLAFMNPASPAATVVECLADVYNVLRDAMPEIEREVDRVEGWILEGWNSANDSEGRTLEPCGLIGWTALSFVRGRHALSLFLAR